MSFVCRALGCVLAVSSCLGAPPVAGVSKSLAETRAGLLSNVRYQLAIQLTAHAAAMTGHEVVSFELSGTMPEPLPLDFRDGRVSEVSVNGASLTPESVNGHVLLPAASLHNGSNTVELDFESAIAESNRAVTRVNDPLDGSEYLYSLFVPMDASLAFPCFDQPDLKARFTLQATAPASWAVVSNTASNTTSTSTGTGVFRFAETKPISTYLFAFAAGPFAELPEPAETHSAVPLRLFVPKSQVARARQEWPEVARYTTQGMTRMAAFFGQTYPFPKYDQVLIPGFPYGGMEHAGATFLREDSVIFRAAPSILDHQRRSALVLHELAHQWFGDLVTMRWFDDLWLKEGFAEYMAFHTLAELEPPAEVWKRFYTSIKPAAYAIDSTPGTTPIYQQVRNLADAKSAYGAIVYDKAPSLLRVLNFRVGEDAFRDALRLYLRQYAFGNATWQDLVAAFSETSKQDLLPWANAWVTQRGMPVVTVNWACAGGKVSTFGVAQRDSLNEGRLWPVSTQVRLVADGVGKLIDANFDSASASVAEAVGLRCPDYVFANSGDHAYGRFLLDGKSMAGVEAGLGAVTDPLERALYWGALWDAVREAELAPGEWVKLTVRMLAKETDLDITQSLLTRTRTAITRYGAPGGEFEPLLMDRTKNAESLDFRIAYFRAFTGASSAPAMVEVENLLAGSSAIPGVALQQRDRWNIVATLVREGASGALGLVDAEAARDGSEDGRRSAFAARAGAGTAENKSRFFEDYRKDGGAPEDFITTSLGNFNAWNQTGLTLPYLKPSLEALPTIKRQRKIFFINGWLASFIGNQTSVAAQKVVEEFLARPALDPDLRLKVLEAKDELDRTVRIRARWP
ncbi:MAG: M1 family aminopeptidase [Acidobacteriota bacterium]|nr:M1 family aminopeptidase [Acidobacteriota bacterium]